MSIEVQVPEGCTFPWLAMNALRQWMLFAVRPNYQARTELLGPYWGCAGHPVGPVDVQGYRVSCSSQDDIVRKSLHKFVRGEWERQDV